MDMIWIYGPPATGKLTVAEELSKLTGYSLFHNHLTVDLAKVIFDYGQKEFEDYRDKLRYEFIETAAKNKANFIFTFCYAPTKEDDFFVNKVRKIIAKYDGKIHFVHLTAEKKELEKRVKSESRKKFHKVKKVKVLRKLMSKYSNFPHIPYVKSLKIDNTKLLPKKVALMIKSHYKL
ncbi:hypothetical protein FJZ21_03890 [Candidatus Pacearchaeota archaeon]|nr:hypothetical protein [Candidatus Pacearchaeota archaeon]